MTDAMIIAYVAFALLSWGFFIAAVPKSPMINCIAAMVWPASWLLILGYLLGDRK